MIDLIREPCLISVVEATNRVVIIHRREYEHPTVKLHLHERGSSAIRWTS